MLHLVARVPGSGKKRSDLIDPKQQGIAAFFGKKVRVGGGGVGGGFGGDGDGGSAELEQQHNHQGGGGGGGGGVRGGVGVRSGFGGGGGGGRGSLDSPLLLHDLLEKAMGQNRECIFQHQPCESKRFLILALFPSKGSSPDKEHENQTSREICAVVGNYCFLWNDLYPYAPVRNGNEDQVQLKKLLDSGSVDMLVTAMQLRMNAFIADERGFHRR
jgi:hypothetical protein